MSLFDTLTLSFDYRYIAVAAVAAAAASAALALAAVFINIIDICNDILVLYGLWPLKRKSKTRQRPIMMTNNDALIHIICKYVYLLIYNNNTLTFLQWRLVCAKWLNSLCHTLYFILFYPWHINVALFSFRRLFELHFFRSIF